MRRVVLGGLVPVVRSGRLVPAAQVRMAPASPPDPAGGRSDRPDRIVGTVETARFLEALGFTPANPPNAALVVRTPAGERDVLVVELFNPVYTEDFSADGGVSVMYEARVLDAYQGEELDQWAAE